LAYLSGFGIESHQKFMSQSNADDFLGFPRLRQALLKSTEIGIMPAHYASYYEQDLPDALTSSLDGAFTCDFPLSSASGAKPASWEIFLLESVPISGISAMSRPKRLPAHEE
jgi:hypothetical protein